MRQTAVLKSGVSLTLSAVPAKRTTNRAPSGPAGTIIFPAPRCTMRPGDGRSAGMSTITGVIFSAASQGANRSRCSTPFCRIATRVCGPTSPGNHAAAPAAS